MCFLAKEHVILAEVLIHYDSLIFLEVYKIQYITKFTTFVSVNISS